MVRAARITYNKHFEELEPEQWPRVFELAEDMRLEAEEIKNSHHR